MEFHEKLQELRKQKGLTQEELANALYVSRTAISKWESGRGYPNIDSLKAIALFFTITVDELLSGDELLTIAQQDKAENETHRRDLLFGLLDVGALILLFLPIFAQRTHETVREVSLLSLTMEQPLFKILFLAIVIVTAVWGLSTLALQNSRSSAWMKIKSAFSLLLSAIAVLVFTLCLQPYPAILLFVFLVIKVLFFIKPR